MERASRKRRFTLSINGPFVPLLYSEQDSIAYQKLTGNSAKLYGYIKRIVRTVGTKLQVNTEQEVIFDFTYSQAKKFGFSEKAFLRGLKDLWSKGFIGVVRIGGRIKSEHGGRVNSQYKLTAYWQTYGKTGEGRWTDRTKFEPNPWVLRSEPDPKETGKY
ncbi:MAG: hypothetical protein M0T70_09160 [Geobacteraceae bacterium]|nr:hypothetical protein [Geobacteraceae bacterium]